MVVLKNENWEKMREWMNAPEPPEPSEVRQTRRFLAATGEYDPLTRRLAEVERRLREGDREPLAPLRSYFRQHSPTDRPATVRMFSREPFRGPRRRVLEQTLELFGGRVVSRSDGSFRVLLGDPGGQSLLKSLYNFSWENEGEPS